MFPRLRRLFLPAKRLGLVAFAFDASASCVLLVVQFRAIELGASPLQLGLIGTLTSLTGMLASLAGGVASDRLGRRAVEVVAFAFSLGSWWLMSAASSTGQLLCLAAMAGVGLGLTWAPLAAWMGDLSGGKERLLSRYLGYYNIGWSAGLMVGPLLAGWLWDNARHLAFAVPLSVAAACLCIVLGTPTATAVTPTTAGERSVSRDVVVLFLLMAWVGGFAASFGRGLVGALFPRLGHDLGYSALTVGKVMFAAACGQVAAFIATRLTTRWQHRSAVQLLTMLLGAVAMAIATGTESPWVFAGCFAVMGAAVAITYAAGMLAAIQATDRPGRLAGTMEAVLSAGLVVGPYLGGTVSQTWGLRASLPLAGAIYLLALMAQVALLVRHHAQRQPADGPAPR
ncbi:MAG: MFS transporter [Armatimonadetes bacterium]|nr:MFS transporter [Armatimonadota bacterium]